jgi:hypothetical protein
MIIQIVRFKSGLSEEQVHKMYETRAPRYRALKDLKQKYYLRFPETGEFGAVYLWNSEAALKNFRESELGRTIASAYQVQGEPNIVIAELDMMLHSDKQ